MGRNDVTPRPLNIEAAFGLLMFYPTVWHLVRAIKLGAAAATSDFGGLAELFVMFMSFMSIPIAFSETMLWIGQYVKAVFKGVGGMYLLSTIFMLQRAVIKISAAAKSKNAPVRAIVNFAPLAAAFALAVAANRFSEELTEHKGLAYTINILIVMLVLFLPPDRLLKKVQTCRGFLWLIFVYGLVYASAAGTRTLAYVVYAGFWLIISLIANTELSKAVNAVIGLITAFVYTLLTHYGSGAPLPFKSEFLNAGFAQMYNSVYAVVSDCFVYLLGVYTLAFVLVTIKGYLLKRDNAADIIPLPERRQRRIA